MKSFVQRFLVTTLVNIFVGSFALGNPLNPQSSNLGSSNNEKVKGERDNSDASSIRPIPISIITRSEPVDFETEILPILQSKCLACHNKSSAKGKLVLETPQDMLKGGNSGPAVVPKKSEASVLLKAAAHQIEDTVMPPPGNKVNAVDMTAEELGLIKLWIEAGANNSTSFASKPVQWQSLPQTWNPIYSIAVTRDGQFVASASGNQIFIYDLILRRLAGRLEDVHDSESGISTPGFAHRGTIHSLAFSSDGNYLASGSYREVKVWQRISPVQRMAQFNTASKEILSVATSPDGKWLAVGTDKRRIELWNLRLNRKSADLRGHKKPVHCIKFSKDGTMLASTSDDGKIYVWDPVNGKLISESPRGGKINSLTWVGESDRIASGGDDGVIHLWSLNRKKSSLERLKELKRNSGSITALGDLPSSPLRIIAGSSNGSIAVWNTESGELLSVMDHGSPVTALATQRVGEQIGSAGHHAIKLWNVSDGKQIAEMKGDRHARENTLEQDRLVCFAKDEVDYFKTKLKVAETNQIAQAERLKKSLEILEAIQKEPTAANNETAVGALKSGNKQAAEQAKSKAESEVRLARNSADQAATATSAAREMFKQAEEKLKEINAKLEGARKASIATEKPVRALAFSSDGSILASCGDDGFIHTWKAEDGSDIETFRYHTELFPALAFTPDGYLFSGAQGGKVLRWDLGIYWTLSQTIGTGEADSIIMDRVNAVAFHPEGRLLALGSGEPTRKGDVQLWDVVTGSLSQSFTNLHSDAVLALAFSPDGEYLASGAADKIIKVINIEHRKIVRQFEGHTHQVLGVSWSRNQRVLVSAGADNLVNIWDFETGEKQKSIAGFDKEVTSVTFSGYTQEILASSADSKTQLFGIDGKHIRSFSGGIDFVNSAMITQDRKIVISGGQDGVLRVWDALDGKLIAHFSPAK
jgi:WD40 repeat protein